MSAPPGITKTPEATATTEAPAGHKPYVPDGVKMPEFTWPAVLVGALLGIIFGASSLYLVLKVGMTVSASIPVAVLSITLFRVFSRMPVLRRFIRPATILENNIVQTTGSAGESIAFGVGVTMPALMLLGFQMDVGRVMVVSVLGGLLGILMMIPLRRAFIVKKHGVLKYPEGTACADVLIVGEQGGSSAQTVFTGFGLAFLFQFVRQGLLLFKDTVSTPLRWFPGATPALETDPTLLGVGYIIGTRISCIMVAGGALAAFVLIPAIRLFGTGLDKPVYPADKLVREMTDDQLQHIYILYIGAGAVAAGGIISLFQALPLIVGSLRSAMRDIRGMDAANGSGRTDRDLPLWLVGVGAVGLVLAIWVTSPLHHLFDWVPQLHMNLLGAVLIVLFGFLFVTVSSRLTGEIGSSSNPISGMTVATLLLTCLIFLALGWDHPEDRLTALSVAAVVCIASSNGGTTSQDLKTGYLVGATPKWQQLAILVGSLSSALVIGVILIQLNNAYTVYSKKDLPTPNKRIDASQLTETGRAPGDDAAYHVLRVGEGNGYGLPAGEYLVTDQGQIAYLVDPGINGSRSRRDDGTEVRKFTAPKATLMAFITDGILQRRLPWTLVLLGVSISVVLELCGISSLAFAVGVYLPLSTSTPIFVGGLVRYVADRWGRSAGTAPAAETDADTSPGVLLSTGYIAGGAIAGVLIAFLNFSDEIPRALSHWQYREVAITRQETPADAAREVALRDLGVGEPVPDDRKEAVDELTGEVKELNADLLPHYVRVPKGTVLQLGKGATFTADEDMYLGDVARKVLGSEDKAQSLLDLNKGTLKLPQELPAGARLKVPQGNWPALAAFGVLVVFLVLVGAGLLFRGPPPGHAPGGNGPSRDGGGPAGPDGGYDIRKLDEPQGEGRT
ncbi:MAG TPA: oligopeptide transporter, OPT family [Gemmataceae bacterium]|nr:oligopeptide transporter, OPT family [Gemmataceae bacterium]